MRKRSRSSSYAGSAVIAASGQPEHALRPIDPRAEDDLLTRGYLGTPVLATIEMRAVPHWQAWLRDYSATHAAEHEHSSPRLRSVICSATRKRIFVSARKDPRTDFPHEDGICLYILEYADGLRASGMGRRLDGSANASRTI